MNPILSSSANDRTVPLSSNPPIGKFTPDPTGSSIDLTGSVCAHLSLLCGLVSQVFRVIEGHISDATLVRPPRRGLVVHLYEQSDTAASAQRALERS